MALFISCDWGTSNLRLRLVDSQARVILEEIETAEGIAFVFRSWKEEGMTVDRKVFYLSILRKHIQNWINSYNQPIADLVILISGMASSSIGLLELEYSRLPVMANGSDLLIKKITEPAALLNPVYLISGVCSEDDVMRGEETLLAGSNITDNITGLFIFPGTHSKHLTVTNGKVEKLKTYMTGEFFDLLSRQSILAASVEPNQEFNQELFRKGVVDGASMNLLNAAFHVRVNILFSVIKPAENYHYLSGLVIGAELKEVINEPSPSITFIGAEAMSEKYFEASLALGYAGKMQQVDAATAMLNGHIAIFSKLAN